MPPASFRKEEEAQNNDVLKVKARPTQHGVLVEQQQRASGHAVGRETGGCQEKTPPSKSFLARYESIPALLLALSLCYGGGRGVRLFAERQGKRTRGEARREAGWVDEEASKNARRKSRSPTGSTPTISTRRTVRYPCVYVCSCACRGEMGEIPWSALRRQ